MRLLNSLWELVDVAEERFDLDQEEMVQTSRNEGDATPQVTELWEQHAQRGATDLDKRWADAWPAFREARGAMSLVLRDSTMRALQKLARERAKVQHVAEDASVLLDAYREVLESAKVDLKLRPRA